MRGIPLLQYSGEQNEQEKTKKRKNDHGCQKRAKRRQNRNRTEKNENGDKRKRRKREQETENRQESEKTGKKGKNANTTKYKRKRKYNKKYGTRDPKAKNGDEESGRMRGVGAATKSWEQIPLRKPLGREKLRRKRRWKNVVPTLYRRWYDVFLGYAPLTLYPPFYSYNY